MGELDDLPDALDLIQVQQRQPPPINQDPLRYGSGRTSPRPQRPASPQAEPSQTAPQVAPALPPQTTDELPDALDIMRGPARPAAPQSPAQTSAAPQPQNYAEPDAPSWLGRRWQDIRGKRDPRYDGLPPMLREIDKLQGIRGTNEADNLSRYALGASDKDLSKMYQEQLGRNFVRHETDANGYPVIVFRDNAGQEKKAYVNRPGLDTEDVVRGAVGGLPFMAAGGVAGAALKGAPLLGRVGGQAVAQAGASVVQDAAAVGTGVSDFDPMHSTVKAGVAAAGGAGAELLGAGVNALMRKSGERALYNSATGTLTPEGEAALRATGVDPATLPQQVAQDFAKAFAKTGNAEAAFKQAASSEAGIRRSMGELTQNREQLLREQQMRGGVYGTPAREAVENFDKLQRADIERAVAGSTSNRAQPTIPQQIAPDRALMLSRGATKADMGENIAGNNSRAYATAKSQERAAWESVPKRTATPETLAQMDSAIANAFASKGGVMVDEQVTPMAANMAKALDSFKAGEAPAKAAKILPDSPANDITTMRKRLLAMRQSAQTPEDKRAAGAVYDGFLSWEVTAAEQAGDIMAAAKARVARETTRQLHEIFDGEKGSSGAGILRGIMKNADSPEAVVNALFTGPTSQVKNGTPSALRNLKQAYDTYFEKEAAKSAWDDVRLAYWIKMTTDRGAEVKTPGALSSAIKTMLGDHASLTRELYSPREVAAMKRLALATQDVAKKNPNTSWSAVGVGALAKDAFNGVLNMIGWNSVAGRTVAGTLARPVMGAYGSTQATRATGGLQGATLPALPGPSWGGYGGAIGSQSQQ